MSSNRFLGAIIALAALSGSCGQERRDFRELPPSGSPNEAVPMGGLRAGGQPAPDSTISRYQSNAYALSQGQRLYQAMNCVGCHFHGGGGIGPPLMDSEWIYGSDPSQIFNTIVAGRPNGMPSFKDKLTNQQVWQLTAYVRALSGLSSTSGTSSREDDMYLSPNLAIREREKPKGETIPRP